MSGDTTHNTAAPVYDDAAPHGTLKSYLTGFGLSVVLTAVPFALVMSGLLGGTAAAAIILALAVVQILVHMVYFLHMNARVEGGWSLLALIFTVIFVVITLAGSIWVMVNMNANMVPQMSPADAAAMALMAG